MRLVVEIKTVGNQLFELDIRRTFERTPAAGPSTFATVATIRTISSMLAGTSTTSSRSVASAARTPFATRFLRRTRRTILPRRSRVLPTFGFSVRLSFLLRRLDFGSRSFRRSRSRFRRRRHSFGLSFVVSYIIHAMSLMTAYSADNLAHSSATRPAGRNFTVTALRPIRSAISAVRAF